MALALLLAPPPVFAQDAERREAVGLAREGQYDPAIAALTELRRRYPADVATAADLAVILTWAERHREALEVFDTIPPGRAPGYALAAAGRAARILGDLGRADRYLAEAMERSPGDRNARVLRILVLTDLQRFEEARTLFWPLAAAEPERLDVLLAGGYLHAQATEWPESLRFYTEALRLAPENREALRGRVLALEAVRAPFQAHELAQRVPKLLDPEESARVAGTESMMRLKWGDLPADDPATSRAEQDAAISALETQVAELQAHPGADPTPLRRARFDLLVAYQNRVRMADAVAVYEALRQEGVPVPAYAGRAAASAYLYLERPEDAEAVYRQTLEQEPADVDGQLGLFYALIEQERYRDAYAVIDALDRARPPFRAFAGSLAIYQEPRKLDAAIPAALARFYGDQLGEAWDRISALAAAAPANVSLQLAKAQVARARGWPRATLETLEPWRALGVDDTGLEVERANALLDIRDYEGAAPAVAGLAARQPERKDVIDLLRRWETDRGWQLDARVEASQGAEPTSNNPEVQATTRLTSRLLGGHWRLTVGQQYTWAEVPEGTVSLNRASFGVTYEGPDFRGLAEVVDLAGTQNRIGGRVTGDWTPDDQWGVHLSGQLAAAETPLRAIKTGVIGNSGEGGVRYRFHESREIGLDWRVTSFSDDNLRQEGFFHLSQRLVDVPRVALTAILELYGSTNSRTDVAYFSPGWIVTPDVAVEAEHLAWRRYRTSLTQALVLTVGATFQQGFDGAPIVVGRYEHRWHWNPRFELTYGVEAGSRVFDGGRQQDYSTYVQFRGKF